MKILVFEHCLRLTGHRIPYASLVAGSFAGQQVVVGIPQLLSGESCLGDYFPPPIDIDFYPVKEQSPKPLANSLSARKSLLALVSKHKPDLVAIPTADGLATLLGLFNLFGFSSLRRVRTDVCLMNGGKARRGENGVSKFLRNLKWWITTRGPWQRLMLIDAKAFMEIENPAAAKIALCPDPVPAISEKSKTEARSSLGLPVDGRLIVSVGRQDKRKGIDSLLRSFVVAGLEPNDRIALVGKLSPEIKPFVKELQSDERYADRILTIDRFVSEKEFIDAFKASDIVAATYPGTNCPSGVVCRAISYNRPVLATNSGWLRWTIEELGAGVAADMTTVESLAVSLESAFELTGDFELTKTGKLYAKFNTVASYQQTWSRGMSWSDESFTNFESFDQCLENAEIV